MSDRFPIQRGEVTAQLVGRYGLRGKVGLDLVTEVVPVVLLDDLSQRESGKPAGGWTQLGASGAGVWSCIGVENPANSETLITVDAYMTDRNANVGINMATIGPALLTPDGDITGAFRDTRIPGTPVGRVSQEGTGDPTVSFAGQLRRFGKTIFPPNTYLGLIPINVTLAPGNSFITFPDGDNVQNSGQFLWTEWPADFDLNILPLAG